MTINFDAWLGETGALQPPDAAARAVAAYRRIQDKPSSVAFVTPAGASVAAQTVRIEYDDSAARVESDAGNTGRRRLVIFGVRDHPTIADTVVDTGYRCRIDAKNFAVIEVIKTIGEIQAIAEALS